MKPITSGWAGGMTLEQVDMLERKYARLRGIGKKGKYIWLTPLWVLSLRVKVRKFNETKED